MLNVMSRLQSGPRHCTFFLTVFVTVKVIPPTLFWMIYGYFAGTTYWIFCLLQSPSRSQHGHFLEREKLDDDVATRAHLEQHDSVLPKRVWINHDCEVIVSHLIAEKGEERIRPRRW